MDARFVPEQARRHLRRRSDCRRHRRERAMAWARAAGVAWPWKQRRSHPRRSALSQAGCCRYRRRQHRCGGRAVSGQYGSQRDGGSPSRGTAADPILQGRLFANSRIKVIWNSIVVAFLGDEASGLTGLLLERNDGLRSDLPVGGAFVAIAHDPAIALFAGQLALDPARLYLARTEFDGSKRAWCVRCGRCAGRGLSPGSDRRGKRLHGCVGGRKMAWFQ